MYQAYVISSTWEARGPHLVSVDFSICLIKREILVFALWRDIKYIPCVRHTTVPEIKMKSVAIGRGVQMPLVGFGLWRINNDSCADAVYNAIKSGYRLFDGACGTVPTT